MSPANDLPFLFLAAVFLATSAPAAERNDWAEGTSDGDDGANRDFYNRAALLPWRNFLGDWWDANGKLGGDAAYATVTIADDDREKPVTWDVTPLVVDWLAGEHQNQGFFLRAMGRSGTIVFLSRESANRKPYR